jgi:ankyrin repeat protein
MLDIQVERSENIKETIESIGDFTRNDTLPTRLPDSTASTTRTLGLLNATTSVIPDKTASVHRQVEGVGHPADNLITVTSWYDCDHCKEVIADSGFHFDCRSCRIKQACQKCYAKGLRCPEDNSHEVIKSIVKRYGDVVQSLPYPELSICEQDSELVKALKQGNLEELDRLARDKEALNAHDKAGYAPLHLAAQLGLKAGLGVLVRHGAKLEVRDSKKHTPLMIAIRYNYPDIFNVLLEQGADFEAEVSENNSATALHFAANTCQADMIRVLLSKKAKVDTISPQGTPLRLASVMGDETCLRLLLEAGANPNPTPTNEYTTPLCTAARRGRSEAVKLLLQYAAEIQEPDRWDKTPLFYAALWGRTTIAKLLLDAGATPNAKCGEDKATPLCVAAQYGHSEIVELLLQYAVDINEINGKGQSPLLWATIKGRTNICQQLVDHNADVDLYSHKTGTTSLMQAASKGHLDIVRLLVKHNAQIDLISKCGSVNALAFAMSWGQPRVVQLLLESGASTIPPPKVGDWSKLRFDESVSPACKEKVLRMVLEANNQDTQADQDPSLNDGHCI